MPELDDLQWHDQSLAVMVQKVKDIRSELCGEKVQKRRFWRNGGICSPIVHLQQYGKQLMDDDFAEYRGVV
jgi:hypothetical protein